MLVFSLPSLRPCPAGALQLPPPTAVFSHNLEHAFQSDEPTCWYLTEPCFLCCITFQFSHWALSLILVPCLHPILFSIYNQALVQLTESQRVGQDGSHLARTHNGWMETQTIE